MGWPDNAEKTHKIDTFGATLWLWFSFHYSSRNHRWVVVAFGAFPKKLMRKVLRSHFHSLNYISLYTMGNFSVFGYFLLLFCLFSYAVRWKLIYETFLYGILSRKFVQVFVCVYVLVRFVCLFLQIYSNIVILLFSYFICYHQLVLSKFIICFTSKNASSTLSFLLLY